MGSKGVLVSMRQLKCVFRLNFDVCVMLCSCDSNSLLAVDLVAANIKHGIQQRSTPPTEVTMTASFVSRSQ